MSRNRDLGIPGGPGKGDNDRTEDREAYEKNLAEIPFSPQDKKDFKQVGPGRFRKTYSAKKPDTKSEGDNAPAPTPTSLLLASRAARSSITGNRSED